MANNLIYKKPIVVCDVCINHQGDFDHAMDMIKEAAVCGADYCKFQKMDPYSCLTVEQQKMPHPNPRYAYGDTYLDHKLKLEFSIAEHVVFKKFCENLGIKYSCSCFDLKSAKDLLSLELDYIKVPSGKNNNEDMLNLLINDYSGDVHISLGITTKKEEEDIINLFVNANQASRLVLYSCTSSYPTSFEDLCLLEITRLIEEYGNTVKDICFSGHHKGIAADISAYTLGAGWIERHFTLDRTLPTTDASLSLEPSGLKKLVRDLNAVHKSLTYKGQEVLNSEKPFRDKLKYRK